MPWIVRWASVEHLRKRYPTIATLTHFSPFTFAPFRALVIDTLRRLGVPE